MTILLYDYHELEERASSHLRAWKAWHTILYILAAILGILNFTFLQNTMELVDGNCVLYPRQLEFTWVSLPEPRENELHDIKTTNNSLIENHIENNNNITTDNENNNITTDNESNNNITTDNESAQTTTMVVPSNNVTTEEKSITVKREATFKTEPTENRETIVEDNNSTIITENSTSRMVLDTSRSLFGRESPCQFAEYMSILSAIAAIAWTTLFIMCPAGGRTRTGLTQPWRILTPALLFALVLVGLTGHAFTSTNGGLHAFCEAFSDLTNKTTCSSVDPFLPRAWNASWSFGRRVAATRAAAAGVWAAWACVAALLLARCLAAPDFVVRRTGVYLIKDPQEKVTPYLKKSPRHSQRSARSSPSKRDTISVRSEPTTTTELVTASVEHGADSAPTSLTATPIKREFAGETIEMVYNPQEHNGRH